MCSTTKFCLCTLIWVDRGRVPGVTWIRQGRQDPRPFGVALFWNAKYHDARSPRIHKVTLRPVYIYRRPKTRVPGAPSSTTARLRQVHLRNVYNYFHYRRREQLLPLHRKNVYFPLQT